MLTFAHYKLSEGGIYLTTNVHSINKVAYSHDLLQVVFLDLSPGKQLLPDSTMYYKQQYSNYTNLLSQWHQLLWHK